MSAAPTAVVLDASAAAAWLLPEQHDAHARAVYTRIRLGDLELHAPDAWLLECGNLIANAVRHARVQPADAMLLWSVLDAVRSRVELTAPVPAQLRAALSLALDYALPLTDALYLWLALSLKLPLLTHNPALQRAAQACAHPTVTLETLAA